MNKLDLSIIIVNWNTWELLKACLNSIYETVRDLEFEIIVIDNASSDRSCEMIEKEFARVRLIKNDENIGFAKANNQGIEVGVGEYILFLNPDTIAKENSLVNMVDALQSNRDIGVIGPVLKKSDNSLQISYGRFPTIFNVAIYVLPYKLIEIMNLEITKTLISKDNRFFEVDYVAGACLMARREIIEQVGNFDERFFAYFEETDFCYRVRSKGWKIAIDNSAEVVHIRGQSLDQLKDERLEIYYESLFKYFLKNKGYLITLLLKIVLILGSLLVIMLIPFAYLSKQYRSKIEKIVHSRWIILRTIFMRG